GARRDVPDDGGAALPALTDEAGAGMRVACSCYAAAWRAVALRHTGATSRKCGGRIYSPAFGRNALAKSCITLRDSSGNVNVYPAIRPLSSLAETIASRSSGEIVNRIAVSLFAP